LLCLKFNKKILILAVFIHLSLKPLLLVIKYILIGVENFYLIMIYYRQKIILALVEAFGGSLKNTDLQKLLFLFSQEQENKIYSFVPYKFGCFSFQSYKDKNYLIENEFLTGSDSWSLKSIDQNFMNQIIIKDKEIIINIKEKFCGKTTNQLLKYVYQNFPYYAINSEILEEVLSENEIKNIISFNQKNNLEEIKLFSIGYEGISIDEYLNKLIINRIKILCDVRKNPLSRKYGFSKSQLSELVGKFGITYIHIPELGINSDDRKKLKTPKDYSDLFEEYANTVLINQTNRLLYLYDIFKREKRLALTCFENNPEFCHRTKIAHYFKNMPDWEYELEEL